MGHKRQTAIGSRGDGGATRGKAIPIPWDSDSVTKSGISKDFSSQWVSATLERLSTWRTPAPLGTTGQLPRLCQQRPSYYSTHNSLSDFILIVLLMSTISITRAQTMADRTDSGALRPRQLPTPQSRVTTLPPFSPSFN